MTCRLFPIVVSAAMSLGLVQCAPVGKARAADPSAACLPVVAFYPSWNVETYPVTRIDWTTLEGVATGFVIPNADGSLNTDLVTPYLSDLVAAAHANGDKVYVAIGGAHGYGDAFQQISRDPDRRASFVANVAAFVEHYNLDGIDIDWELWTWQSQGKGGRDPDESPLLGLLLKDLRAGLPKEVKLSVDVFAGDWVGLQYTADIQDHVDHVNLMAYDFTGAWQGSPVGHHASFDMTQKAVKWLVAQGFDPHKVWLGQPAYGIEFADGKSASGKHVPHREIVARLSDDPSALAKGRKRHLYFDSVSDSRKKSEWATQQTLSGIFFFELTGDSEALHHSLIRASREGLGTRLCDV